jgi:hypothetical protein
MKFDLETKLFFLLSDMIPINALTYSEYEEGWYLTEEYRDELTCKILKLIKPKRKEKT